MKEHEIEQAIAEWMHSDPTGASAWVLPSVVEHAERHSNQGPWGRLRHAVAAQRTGQTVSAPQPRRRFAALAALSAAALAVALVVGLLLPGSETDRYPAFLPAPTVSDTEGGAGSIGSLWLERTEDGPDSYVTLHPDGTVVRVTISPGHPVGIGVWRPTGERSLSAVLAYPDADVANHLRPGSTIYRAEWGIDESARSADLTWSATMTRADGSEPIEADGRSTLTRLARRALPPEAKYPAPPEPEWELTIGPMIEGAGSGTVAALAASCTDSFDTSGVEFGDPPEYLVLHGDGTAFLASLFREEGAGLWARTGPDARALSSWFSVPGSPPPHTQTTQLIGAQQMLMLTGDGEAFRDKTIAARRRIEPMDDPLPSVDPTLWPATGSVWLTSLEEGTAITALLTDGTVISLDPRYGTGAGYWQPLDASTIAGSVGFSTYAKQDHHIWSEAVIDGDTMHITYKHQDQSGGPVEHGQALATRLRLEP